MATTDDDFAFAYDHAVVDRANDIRLDVTLCDARDDEIQFRLKSGRLDIPFFMHLEEACQLAHAILAANEAADI